MAGEYTPNQKARINAAVKEAMKGTRRPRRNKYAKAIDALGDVADDFRGFDRDDISHVIDILSQRANDD